MKIEGKIRKQRDEKYWGVEIPEIGVFTQGRTRKKSYKMAKEAIELLVDYEDFKVKIEPGKNDTFLVNPNKIGPILALVLKQKRIDNGLTIREVALRLGQTSPNAYSRYETGRNIPTLKKFDELVTAINSNSSVVLKVS